MKDTLIEVFRGELRGKILADEPLRHHTSFRVGGPADLLFFPDDAEDLGTALRRASLEEVPVFIVGNGTNMLVRDGGVRGLTILLTSMSGIAEDRPVPENPGEGENIFLSALSGTLLSRIINYSSRRGLSGLEFAAGIPGTAGGAAIMNAGAHGSSFGDIVTWIELVDSGGEVFRCEREEMEFFYRGSSFPRRGVVARVGIRLEYRGEVPVMDKIKWCMSERQKRLPFGVGMAGSVFKNPHGDYAGRLIEAAGLKGMRAGRAEVSQKHANVIVNLGGATAADILRLVETVAERVEKDGGVRLEPEIRIVGED